MKISIITATYNSESTIEKTLASVANQTHSDIEHIIVDGASKDKTIDVIRKYKHVDKVVSEADNGIYDALNKGIRIATGDIIGLLHADDFYPDINIVEKINSIFENKKCDALYGDLDYVSLIDTNKIIRHWSAGKFEKIKLRKGWMPPHPTFYVKKDLYKKFGNFNIAYKIAADYDLMLRFLSQDIEVKYLPEVIVKMCVGGVSNRGIKNILKKSSEDLKVLRRNNIGGVGSLLNKNFSKISQFWKK